MINAIDLVECTYLTCTVSASIRRTSRMPTTDQLGASRAWISTDPAGRGAFSSPTDSRLAGTTSVSDLLLHQRISEEVLNTNVARSAVRMQLAMAHACTGSGQRQVEEGDDGGHAAQQRLHGWIMSQLLIHFQIF